MTKEAQKIVFSFDRDGTIDVNPLHDDQCAIPLEWVQYLSHCTEHEVWAHGNQSLKEEAGIPGTAELFERYKVEFGDPIEQVNARDHKDLETQLSITGVNSTPDPDIVTAAANWYKRQKGPSKQQYLRLVQTLIPDADKYVCVDNQYLGYVPEWEFHYSHEFVDAYEEFLTNELQSVTSSQLDSYAEEFEHSSAPSVRRINFLSSFGQYLPRYIRERFEIKPDKTIPIGIRKK